MRIQEFCERDAITQLELTWRALQEEDENATPFQTWEWNEAWWRHLGQRCRARILLFYSEDGKEPVGLAPLCIEKYLNTPLRRLMWLGTGHSDYLGFLARPGYENEVARSLLNYLSTSPYGWHLADLQQLKVSSPLLASELVSSSACTSLMEPCPYLTLPPRWEELTQRIGKKLRFNIGYYERLLRRSCSDTAITMATGETLEGSMKALFTLHQHRWNAKWLPGVLGNRKVQAFHMEVAHRFLERGWLRLHTLKADSALRAVIYCFAFRGRTYYYQAGFAPEYARYSPGTILVARAIRTAVEEGHTEFDFLRGQETYKYRWHPQERWNYRLVWLQTRRSLQQRATLAGRVSFALHRLERYVEAQVKANLRKKEASS